MGQGLFKSIFLRPFFQHPCLWIYTRGVRADQRMGEYIINWSAWFSFFDHISLSLSFMEQRNINIHAYLGYYCFIFSCLLSFMTTEGVKSKKLSFIDLGWHFTSHLKIQKKEKIMLSSPKPHKNKIYSIFYPIRNI